MVPIPFLNANKLADRMEFDSSHQSSLDLSINSKTLHIEEESPIVRNEVLLLGLGI